MNKLDVFRHVMPPLIAAAILVSACNYEYDYPTIAQNEPTMLSSASAIPAILTLEPSKPGAVPQQPSISATNPVYLPTVASEANILVQDISFEILEKIDLESALTDLRLLTGEEPVCLEDKCYTITSRETGSKGLSWAKKYIDHELANLGYSVEYHDWSRGGYSDQNMIVRKVGILHPKEELYFIAHLDGAKPSLLSRRPAANDNASGVVDLLQLARVLSSYSFERTFVLLFSTGEEQGTLGVKSYLEQLSLDRLKAIKYAVNIDVIGYDANQDHVMELWHGDHPPSLELVGLMSQIIHDYQLDLTPVFIVGCG